MTRPVSRTSEGFLAALIGDGRPLILLTAIALAIAGGGAIFVSLTGHFLPHDVAFLGMQAEALCQLNQCRIVHFMIHDRIAFGGVLITIATLYAWLALFPLKSGESWAWWTLLVTNATGFAGFLAYIGYGYLDTWHAWATLALLPCAVAGIWRTRSLCRVPASLAPARPLPGDWRAPETWGRLLWLGWGAGITAAGATILVIGMTEVFVPSDLAFIGYGREELHAINPRLVPLIAHDRAGFGGGLFTAGLLVLAIVWKAAPSRHAWEALTLAGIVGFGCAIGVHYPIGYTDPVHLAPAWLGAVVFAAGAWLLWRADWGESVTALESRAREGTGPAGKPG